MKFNKRIFLSAVAALLVVTTFLGSATYASNNIPEGSSVESIQKFNDYIASLPTDYAQIILDDEELVYSMKLDSYWEEPQENSPSSLRFRPVFPLDEYPAGSYFTYNGNVCTCHSSYANHCSYNRNYSTVRCCNTVNHSLGNCKVYTNTGSIQCKGFADYVYHHTTGHDIGSSYVINTDDYSSIGDDETGAALMKTFLKGLKDGSNVRVSVRGKSYNHSFIVSDIRENGIYLYDANRTDLCKVDYKFKTWEQLAGMYDGVVCAWKL